MWTLKDHHPFKDHHPKNEHQRTIITRRMNIEGPSSFGETSKDHHHSERHRKIMFNIGIIGSLLFRQSVSSHHLEDWKTLRKHLFVQKHHQEQ
ncbi:hypothetical protein V1478_009204 [Vespula squamosa]|uniref:Uncharacterized protein n=1 Tax=Vespula squamosa TaxID=30214 RepID=A0ABD2ANZ4_VESSQ